MNCLLLNKCWLWFSYVAFCLKHVFSSRFFVEKLGEKVLELRKFI